MEPTNACLGIFEQKVGDCVAIDNVIDSRLPREMRVTVFEREIFPGEFAELTVNVATNKPVDLSFVKIC